MKKQRAEKEGFSEDRRGQLFVRELLHWNRYDNGRRMPWKGEKDPYKIWLSEVMLQQTRVEQGLKYYQNFLAAFPDVHALAAAPDEKVFKFWEGLGYYSRCRNLLQTARYISGQLNGVFPKTYNDILALKGIGSYTAAAIGSFAYNLPCAVLDGNVFRVLSRIFDKEVPIDSTRGKKAFSELAQRILPDADAGEYNQAIMDFGATICKPSPVCDACFFSHACLAYRTGKQQWLPVKEKRITLKKRWLNYFIVRCGDQFLIQPREGKDIWHGLYQFVLIETETVKRPGDLLKLFQQQTGLNDYTLIEEWKEKQALSHQSISFHFFSLRVSRKKNVENYGWTKLSQLQELAFPKTL
ncbi:MAG TPA: A/G-specific adenine glycosylase, partial [Flavisolibacter sp.]|nr:A/G-specific adenine glycosylase [Flavisolibacter sp.]